MKQGEFWRACQAQMGAETTTYQGPAVLSSPKSALTNPLTWVLGVTAAIFAGTVLMNPKGK